MRQLDNYELENNNYTCMVKHNDKVVFTSKEKGVKPLLDYINEEYDYTNITVIDKIIGKGAMCLAIKCKATKVITPIISQKALDTANMYNVDVHYKEIVPEIINRTGTGPCPIENAVSSINNIEEAYSVIINTLQELSNK
ncbi:TonB-dependent receptor [Vallitalea longa]|uniref:TonB-dependent receptor n=1 Tax=Vallitalea longa TaxID=2936439 RepID=A0A9W5YDG7_9FIRM|nr:DUF1893 domain-containing protein [Vallitalea longa]GKX29904.1 TonB-dependent receptor [Vallitalea longa]